MSDIAEAEDLIDLEPPERGFIRGRALAVLFGTSERTIQRWTDSGEFPVGVRIGGRFWKYPLAAVNRYLVAIGHPPITQADADEYDRQAAAARAADGE